MENEIWKELDGYGGKYAISNYGQIKNISRGSFVKLIQDGSKIRAIATKDGKSKNLCVTDLVQVYFPNGNLFVHENYEKLNSIHSKEAELSDLADEIWRPIGGYEGLYEVSNLGRVKSLSRTVTYTNTLGKTIHNKVPATIRAYGTNPNGYLHVPLSKSGKLSNTRLHRLVAEAFIENPGNLPQVNHIDGDKRNNTASNLEWVTHQENIAHANRTGLISDNGPDSVRAKLTWEDVRYIRSSHGLLQRELAEMFGVGTTAIRNVIHYKSYKNDPMEETKNG